VFGISIYNTIWIIFAAYLVRFLTRSIRPIVSAYFSIDRALDEAGAMCGAGFLERLRTIVLPLVAPTAFAAALIVFMAAFNELTVSILLWSAGSETVGVMIFNLKQGGDVLEASAMSCLTVLLTVLLMAALSVLGRHLPAGVIPWRT
jgi:iron(III) transport system permease protein